MSEFLILSDVARGNEVPISLCFLFSPVTSFEQFFLKMRFGIREIPAYEDIMCVAVGGMPRE